MSNHVPALILGGVPLEAHCGPVRQNYQPVGGSTLLTMADGTGFKQSHWKKTRVSSAGTGYQEPAVEHLDFSGPLELWCVKPLSVSGTALQYELPAAAKRRPDEAPWAIALVGGLWVDASLVMAGDLAQLTAVPGASRYRVSWLPRFLVYTDGVVSDFDEATGRYDWSFEARER